MTSFDDLERRLTARLDERAAPRAPDGLDEAISKDIAGTAQRPAWATLERWIPMETRAQLGAVPRAVVVLALLALLTLVMATAITIGASTSAKLPPPFGPAGNGLIAFQSAGDVFVVRPDGTDLRQITDDPEWQGDPRWSRDGTRLAIWSGANEDEGPLDLLVTDAEGREPVVIAQSPAGGVNGWTWSEDGSEIMFSAIDPDLIREGCLNSVEGNACGSRLYVAATDGSGSRQVGDPDLDARGPALSPNGTTVAFGGGEAANQDLYLMNWDGSDVRLIESEIPGVGWAFAHQSWHPDGRTLVTHDGQPSQNTWRFGFDEIGEPTSIERFRNGAYWPEFAPDGSAILWNPDRGGMEVYFVRSAGSPVSPPVHLGNFEGEWAPDGLRLIGVSGNDLVILDQSGGDPVVVVEDVTDAWGAWQRVAD
jgi:hypothetical protein